jgi:glycosyltransferase involved in cell wall biosynthesis
MENNRKFIIAFVPASNNGLSYRGTEIALFDYMFYLEKLLGHKAILCLGKNAYNEPSVLLKFKKEFDIIIYFTNGEDLENQLIEHKVDACYLIRSGRKQEPMLKTIPMLIHCVYNMSESYGLVTAGVSKSVADKFNKKEYVPHMINLYDTNENYRKELKIPENAIVGIRLGGSDSFDLIMAKNVILKILKNNLNIYFIFAVKPQCLIEVFHERLICLEPFADLETKRKLINTANFMIHAQSLGESFGLSIGEASQCNIPIMTFNGGVLQEHLRILGNKCILYNNEEELYNIIMNFNPEEMKNKDWKAYDDYTPEKVINIFDNVFLEPLRKLLY